MDVEIDGLALVDDCRGLELGRGDAERKLRHGGGESDLATFGCGAGDSSALVQACDSARASPGPVNSAVTQSLPAFVTRNSTSVEVVWPGCKTAIGASILFFLGIACSNPGSNWRVIVNPVAAMFPRLVISNLKVTLLPTVTLSGPVSFTSKAVCGAARRRPFAAPAPSAVRFPG